MSSEEQEPQRTDNDPRPRDSRPSDPSQSRPGDSVEQENVVPPGKNRLLSALPSDDFNLLEPHLERVELAVHDVIAEAGQPFTHAYFPETSVTSILNRMSDGSTVEVGTIGNEGMAGLAAYLEAEADHNKTICQVAGTALRVPVPALIAVANERRALRRLLNRFAQAYMIQVSQSAACNRLHSIEQRCARWLLMTHDRVDGAELIHLKQEFLAVMLGVRRAGVTIAAGALQDAGLIRYRRGGIRVLDREGLEAASCECYQIVREQFNRLLG